MNQTIIENTDRWNITSHGNGAAYTIHDKLRGRSAFIQPGDDATAWRANYDAMREAQVRPGTAWFKRTWNACLAEVCEPYLEG